MTSGTLLGIGLLILSALCWGQSIRVCHPRAEMPSRRFQQNVRSTAWCLRAYACVLVILLFGNGWTRIFMLLLLGICTVGILRIHVSSRRMARACARAEAERQLARKKRVERLPSEWVQEMRERWGWN